MKKLSFKTIKLGEHIGQVKLKVKGYPEAKNYKGYGVTNAEGVVITGKRLSDDLSNYIVVKGDTFVYNPYRINVGSIGLTPKKFEGVASPAYIVFKTKKSLNSEFLLRYLKSPLGLNLIKWYGDRGGVRSALRYSDLEKIDFPNININDQLTALKEIKAIEKKKIELLKKIELQEQVTKGLRQAILQDAIQGKLVPQNPNDEPASELLKKIKIEKEEFIKEKKIKKEKPLPPITQEEIPFILPKNWEWCRLGEAGIVNPRNIVPDNKEVSFIPMTLISNVYNKNPEFKIKKWGDIKSNYTHFANNDVGVAKITPCFENSKAGVFKNLKGGIGAGTTELYIFRGNPNYILSEYIYVNIKTSNFLLNGKKNMRGVAGQKRVPLNYFKEYILPLPPLTEQKAIVEKVDVLIGLCDQLEKKAKSAKEDCEKLFQAVLQEAFKFAGKEKAKTKDRSSKWCFDLMQYLGFSIDLFEQTNYPRGQVAHTKLAYLGQELYGLSFGVEFGKDFFGPSHPDIKKAIGVGFKNKYFKIKNKVLCKGENFDQLMKSGNSPKRKKAKKVVKNLFTKLRYKSSLEIELIASLCKVVQDSKFNEFDSIKSELKKWKKSKYTLGQIEQGFKFLKENNWDKLLLKIELNN